MKRWAWAFLFSFFALACATNPSAQPQSLPVVEVQAAAEPTPDQSPNAAPANREALGPLPIYDSDARQGRDDAPVTVVAFIDLQCPFCMRAQSTLDTLLERYGRQRLRIVYKHNPLPFHEAADDAARAALEVRKAAGDDAFAEYIRHVYNNQRLLTDQTALAWAHSLVPAGWTAPPGWSAEAQLQRDMALARTLGATGTPAFFINGVRLVGAQPEARFAEIIDAEIAATAKLPPTDDPIHVARAKENYHKVPEQPGRAEPTVDTHIWKIPIEKSPTLGPADALVTIVEFGNYQCPFCGRVQETLAQIRKAYGDDIRIVYKHNPLPFHRRASPAAQLAVEAYVQKGNDAFWRMNEALYAAQDRLEDDDLLALAERHGLDLVRTKRTLTQAAHDDVIQADQNLAQDVNARGTPHFFINGRRLSGAQPLEKFKALIDEQLEKARALVRKGTPRHKLYETIQRDARVAPGPELRDPTPPPADRPVRGRRDAPVTVQIFADFQCPFCARVEPTLQLLRKEYGPRLRIVWRHLPLRFHREARRAANAALEVRAQRGDDAFWKVHDLLLERQSQLASPGFYEQLAQDVGADPVRVRHAVETDQHGSIIDSDLSYAASVGIRGTPGFLINGYFVSGAQPAPAFRRVVDRALEDIKHGRKPKVTPPPYK